MTKHRPKKNSSRSRAARDVEASLASEIDATLLADLNVARLASRIRAAQRRLQRSTTKEAWQLYLRVEEITNERYEYVSRLLMRANSRWRER